MSDSEMVLNGLVDRVVNTRGSARLDAAKELQYWSARRPGEVYPHFDTVAGLLRDENSIVRWNAILTLGSLACADHAGKLDALLDEYLAPLEGPHLIDAGNTIKGAVEIALAKPYLAFRIARAVMRTERGEYATAECRNVALGHALDGLARLWPLLAETDEVERFIRRQLANTRTATRRKAEAFARKRLG